jgi:hypothetical protein
MYKVSINIASATLQALKKKNLSLVAVKPCRGSWGVPVVWHMIQTPSETNTVAWSNEYKGFISDSPAVDREVIKEKKSFSMAPGQTAHLDYEGKGHMATTEALPDDDTTTYYFLNDSIVNVQSVGLAAVNPTGVSVPIYATSYLSNSLVEVQPQQSAIFFGLADAHTQVGQSMSALPAAGVLLHLKADEKEVVTLSLDGEEHWQCHNAARPATLIPPHSELQKSFD